MRWLEGQTVWKLTSKIDVHAIGVLASLILLRPSASDFIDLAKAVGEHKKIPDAFKGQLVSLLI